MADVPPGTATREGLPIRQEAFFPLPGFGSPAEERLHRKQRLAGALRIFGRLGFDEGVAGHMTVRDPERTNCFWVNPLGTPFALVRVSDLLLVDEDGQVMEGRGPLNAAAFAIHAAIHAARPDVVAAAHAHSPYGKAWSTLGRLLDPITQDAAPFFEEHALHPDYGGIVADPAEGRAIARTLGHRRAVILANHGLLTVGRSVDEAAWWFIALERACQVQLLAEAAGQPRSMDPAVARSLGADLAPDQAHRSGWIHFQPMYRQLLAEDPGFLA